MVKYSLQEEIDYAKRIIARDKKDLDISETLKLGKEKKRVLVNKKEVLSFQQNKPELKLEYEIIDDDGVVGGDVSIVKVSLYLYTPLLYITTPRSGRLDINGVRMPFVYNPHGVVQGRTRLFASTTYIKNNSEKNKNIQVSSSLDLRLMIGGKYITFLLKEEAFKLSELQKSSTFNQSYKPISLHHY